LKVINKEIRDSPVSPPSETPNKQAYLTFAIVALALLMSAIDMTIISVALPTMLTDFKTNLAIVGWTITGYQFSQSIVMPIAGKLSDELGRKRLFMVAVIVFTVSSLAAGLAPNIYWLIIFRVIQGIGGGTFLPSATGIVSDAFGSRRATAIGLFGSIMPIGGIIGPNLGGFFVQNLSWRWIFFINVPIGILLIILGYKKLPSVKTVNNAHNNHLDIIGLSLFVGGILAILYGITNWANNPAGASIMTWSLFAAGAVLLVLFMRYEGRIPKPMLEPKLLKWRPLLAVNIYNFIYGAVTFGLVSFIPYYATVAYGMNAQQEGLLLTPRSIAMIIFSTISSVFIIRFRYRLPMLIGALICSANFFLLGRGYHDVILFGHNLSNLVFLSIVMGMTGIGMGVANPAANNAALDLMPEKVAAVSGMRGMFRCIGGVLGTAIVTLLLSQFSDHAIGMQYIYTGFGILLLCLIPIIFIIPDTAHQKYINVVNE